MASAVVDDARLSAITHEGVPLACPVELGRATGMLDLLAAGPGDRVLGVGCGRAELLIRLAERTGASCLGVDPSEPWLVEARWEAAARAPWVRFEQARTQDVDLAPGSFDVVLCVGATPAFGRWDEAAAAARRLSAAGWAAARGRELLAPRAAPRHLEALGADRQQLPDLDGLLRGAGDAGLEVRHMIESDRHCYERRLIENGERFALENPDDPYAEAVAAWVAEARARLRASGDHDTLGFALMVMRRNSSDVI